MRLRNQTIGNYKTNRQSKCRHSLKMKRVVRLSLISSTASQLSIGLEINNCGNRLQAGRFDVATTQ